NPRPRDEGRRVLASITAIPARDRWRRQWPRWEDVPPEPIALLLRPYRVRELTCRARVRIDDVAEVLPNLNGAGPIRVGQAEDVAPLTIRAEVVASKGAADRPGALGTC